MKDISGAIQEMLAEYPILKKMIKIIHNNIVIDICSTERYLKYLPHQNRFIEITVDGKITGNELKDFVMIKKELESISMTIDSLKLWTDQMLSDGLIDQEEYEKLYDQA